MGSSGHQGQGEDPANFQRERKRSPVKEPRSDFSITTSNATETIEQCVLSSEKNQIQPRTAS